MADKLDAPGSATMGMQAEEKVLRPEAKGAI